MHPKRAKNMRKKMKKGIVDRAGYDHRYRGIQKTFRRFGRL